MIHYHNGGYSDEGIRQDPEAPAFRYGAGFFETLYYNGRDVCHLGRHLDRILSSLRDYGIPYVTVDFEQIIGQVLSRNGLVGQTARVNIFYPIESANASPVIMAAPYEAKPYKAYRLCICEDRHVSTLNGQKTTSYMFFHLALRRAKSRGFDDVALFDFGDNLLEAATGAIVLEKDGRFVFPDSQYRLRSTTLELAMEVLDILPARIPMHDLASYRHAYLLNSLIGMRPVVAIGETAFVPDDKACDKVSALVLNASD